MSSVFQNVEFLCALESMTVDGKDARKLVFIYDTLDPGEPGGIKKMKR